MAQKSAEERIERARLQIMKHPGFCCWAGLLFVGSYRVEDDPAKCPTAYVDKKGNTVYGRAFVDSLPVVGSKDTHVNFLVLHETGHIALMHLIRGEKYFKENPQIANIAADHVVNLLIHETDPNEDFAAMILNPDGTIFGCRDVKYKGWSFKEVYNDILKDAKEGGGTGKGKAMDAHDVFTDYDTPFEKVEEEMKQLQNEIEQALRTGSYLASKNGASGDRLVGDLREPEIDWKEHMAEFVTEVCQGEGDATWSRKVRRFIGNDEYFPGEIMEAIGEIVCCPDESGSVSQAEHNACISEVVNLCRTVRPSKLRIIYWSDGITREEVYTPEQYDDIMNLTKPCGGGGTVIEPVADYVATLKDVQAAIILTDGGIYGDWGNWNVPTLWCMTRKHVTAPVGKSLYLNIDY